VNLRLQILSSYTINRKKETVLPRYIKAMILQKVLLMLQLIIILSIKNNHSLKYHLLLNLIVKELNLIVTRCQVRIFLVKAIIMDSKAQKIYYFNKVRKRRIFLINKCKMYIKISRTMIIIFIKTIVIKETIKFLMIKTTIKWIMI
jgi:hypothetical protein